MDTTGGSPIPPRPNGRGFALLLSISSPSGRGRLRCELPGREACNWPVGIAAHSYREAFICGPASSLLNISSEAHLHNSICSNAAVRGRSGDPVVCLTGRTLLVAAPGGRDADDDKLGQHMLVHGSPTAGEHGELANPVANSSDHAEAAGRGPDFLNTLAVVHASPHVPGSPSHL